MEKYLAMIAMDQKRVILLVEDDLHDRVHDSLRYLDFLGTLHFYDAMADTVGSHKR